MKTENVLNKEGSNPTPVSNMTQEAVKHAEDVLNKAKTELLSVSDDVKEQTKIIADSSIEMAKKYPLHTALGAAAIGFAAGLFLRSSSNDRK